MNDLLLLIIVLGAIKLIIGWRTGCKYVTAETVYDKRFNWTVVPYYSNGKLIHEPHWLHYAKTLSLLHLEDIDQEDILKASSSILAERVKSDPYFRLTERRKISAATFFLLDKWNYLSHLN